MFCNLRYCKKPWTHHPKDHICDKCHGYGHSYIGCSRYQINRLPVERKWCCTCHRDDHNRYNCRRSCIRKN